MRRQGAPVFSACMRAHLSLGTQGTQNPPETHEWEAPRAEETPALTRMVTPSTVEQRQKRISFKPESFHVHAGKRQKTVLRRARLKRRRRFT